MRGTTQEQSGSEKERLDRSVRILLYAIGAFGILLLWSSAVATWENVHLLVSGRRALGVVTEHKEEWSDSSVQRSGLSKAHEEGYLFYRAVVSVETAEEGTATILTARYRPKEIFPVGSQMEVIYLPGHPENGRIKTEVVSFGGPIIIAAIGIVLLGLSSVIMVRSGEWKMPQWRR